MSPRYQSGGDVGVVVFGGGGGREGWKVHVQVLREWRGVDLRV